MPKLKKLFSIFVTFLIVVFLVVLGLATYLLASGAKVKYSRDKKSYVLDVSKNEFVSGLLVKYSINIPLVVESVSESSGTESAKPNPFKKINEEVAKTALGNSYNMAQEVVDSFKEDAVGFYFLRAG